MLLVIIILQLQSVSSTEQGSKDQISARSGPEIYFQLQKRGVALSQELWLLHVKIDLFHHQRNVNKLVTAASRLRIDIHEYNSWQARLMTSHNVRNRPQGFSSQLLYLKENSLLMNEIAFIEQKIKHLQKKYYNLIEIFSSLDDKSKKEAQKLYENRIHPGLKPPDQDGPTPVRKKTVRKKRFVGLMGMALGLYSFASISALKSQVRLLVDRSNELALNQGRINLWLQESTRLTTENARSITALKAQMNDLTTQIGEEMTRQAAELQDFRHHGHLRSILRSSISILVMIEQDLSDSYQDLNLQLFSALHGKFPLDLLNLNNLTHTMDEINKHLPETKQLALTTRDLRNVFQLPALVFTTEEDLYITLTFPVIRSAADHYDIFSIHTTPLIMENSQIGHYVLDDKIAGLAVNLQKNTFKELTTSELAECSIDHVLSCAHVSHEHKNYRSRNCLFAYFMKETEKYIDYCVISPMQSPPPFVIHEIAPNHFMVYTETQRSLQSQCIGMNNFPDLNIGQGTHFIKIPQICMLQDSQFILYGTEHHESTIELDASLNKQIDKYLEYIGTVNISEVKRTVIDLQLPKITLQDTSQLSKYLGHLAEQVQPYFEPLEQQTDWVFWLTIAAIITLALIIVALAIGLWYYVTKNGAAVNWAAEAAKNLSLPKLVELLPLANSQLLNQQTNQTMPKSAKKRASLRMRDLDQKLGETIQALQMHTEPRQPATSHDKSLYPNILTKLDPTPPTIHGLTYSLPPSLQSTAPSANNLPQMGATSLPPPSY